MNDDVNRPTHRITFAEKTMDAHGNETVGRPVEVAAVFGREGKEGGIISWNISPEKLGDGVYFHFDNTRDREAQQPKGVSEDTNRPTHRITFASKAVDSHGNEVVGRPFEVGAVFSREGKQGGIIRWNISPEKLKEGVYFQFDHTRDREVQQDKGDSFDQADRRSSERDAQLER